MEMELEPRVKPLPFKIKAMSRESPAQKAAHILESDLRTHWSTGTNTKEWILLELDEACLLSHIRIYNKSVLEWEITAGLRYKPEAFAKVRPRCEAPRRDMLYPINYTPCRYVRISCLRGNPIAIYFIQLIGVPVGGLESEFQPVVNYLLPHIISNKQDAHDMHLQLLQDMTNRLLFFLPQLETDLTGFTDAPEANIRFLAMLAGPFYPILWVVHEREGSKAMLNPPDSDAFKNNQTSTLTVSSNFEAQPRRSRSPLAFIQPASSSIAFRSDAVVMLLRKAYKDSHLGIVCRVASRALHKLVVPIQSAEESMPVNGLMPSSVSVDIAKTAVPNQMDLADYSGLFGEEFRTPDDHWDAACLNVLDTAAVEEGILHMLYACASQPLLSQKLANSNSDFCSIMPLVQALLPALRPLSAPDLVDDDFCQWKHPSVQQALSKIVTMTSSAVYYPLLRACAGFLASFSSSHVKAACLLLDLCSGPFFPWISTIIAKVDLAIELVEDLLGIIQATRQSVYRARAALKYIILALSGNMDAILPIYKEVKHKLLFLIEMLESFLDPAITPMKNSLAFGNDSAVFSEELERDCAIALNVIRTAARRAAVLPSLESEWRQGSVAPSVLLSILGPHMPLPSGIDNCKPSASKDFSPEPLIFKSGSSVHLHEPPSKSNSTDVSDVKIDADDTIMTPGVFEDANFLFAPSELKKIVLASSAINFMGICPEKSNLEYNQDSADGIYLRNDSSTDNFLLDNSFSVSLFNLQADYLQLVNYKDCELRASEFQHLALDLCSQPDIPPEGHDAAIDALLLAAECYVNPFFMMAFRPTSNLINQMNTIKSRINHIDQINDFKDLDAIFQKSVIDLETVAHLERNRDKTVLQILFHAAKLDRDYREKLSQADPYEDGSGGGNIGIEISPENIQSADAVTLVRNNQALLCHFVMQQLQREQHSSHEILLQSLLFLLHSATKLFCPPENVIDIILQSAENLNRVLSSLYYQLQEGNMKIDPEKLHGAQRHWVILQSLVIASSGTDNGSRSTKDGFKYRTLVPPSSWMHKIPKFSKCSYPLPRFLGWMAVSRYAKQYLNERLFLASDLSELTLLLSIFSDELALIDNIRNQKAENSNLEESGSSHFLQTKETLGLSKNRSAVQESFRVLYPDMHKFFPNMKKQFGSFGEIILESVGLHLKCLPSSIVPDVLCWFSDLCLWPYSEPFNGHSSLAKAADHLKGYTAINAKAVVLYILESIVSEHMEAVLPEMPMLAQILISLSKSSFSDVGLLDSVMCLLRPLISYSLRCAIDDEKQLTDISCHLDFEQSFEEIFSFIKGGKEYLEGSGGSSFQGSLVIFILGTLFLDLSYTKKNEAIHALLSWVDFTSSEPTSSFYNYLCAFQKLIENCIIILVQHLRSFGINIPDDKFQLPYTSSTPISGRNLCLPSVVLASVKQSSDIESKEDFSGLSYHLIHLLSPDEMLEFSKSLELFVSKLFPAIEASWKLHHQLATRLTFESAKCILFSRCLSSVTHQCPMGVGEDNQCLSDSGENASKHWMYALEGFMTSILAIQQNNCWEVACAMLDFLLMLPENISLDCVVGTICSALKYFCHHAPRISWRLQTGKWLSCLFERGIENLDGDEASLVDLFAAMLGHSEPEQRSVAVRLLGRIVGLDTYGAAKLHYTVRQSLVGTDSNISVSEQITGALVSSTWDRVAELAFSDPSIQLKMHAMALLLGYIPFAGQTKLRSFLIASNTLMQSMGKLSHSVEEGHLTQISLSILANACLYSPLEDIALVPENVWRNMESMGLSRTGPLDDVEKKLCIALCRLRTENGGAREALKESLLSNTATTHSDPKFQSTRETILQVLSSLISVQPYFDFFSREFNQESQDLEEAEIEMELLQKEGALREVSGSLQEETIMPPDISYHKKHSGRLQRIKDDIRSIEKSELREEIIVRRQKKLLMRRARQKYLEEAAARETELFLELDKERANEVEHEVERQRELELQRAKTRELQFNLDMERERQTQKELQRELEQVESGVRSSRREYSSNPSSRPRERYRERENGRPGHEGGPRSSTRGSENGPAHMATSSPSIVLAGSRSFSGQLPTILQSRDRTTDEHGGGGGYEESVEGGRDSGDGSSMGDPELASAFDGLPGGYGSAPRHGSRGSKSRQIVDRREPDGRREGKWERKYS